MLSIEVGDFIHLFIHSFLLPEMAPMPRTQYVSQKATHCMNGKEDRWKNLLYIVINIKQVSKYISLYQICILSNRQALRETTSPDQFCFL